jgi:predicted helicase
MTANPDESRRSIVDIYRYVDGTRIRERGAIMFERTLQDDFVKFHALADRLTSGRPAIRSYISNSAYFDSPSLRGMRCYLTHAWPNIQLSDLPGDVKRLGDADENVFDIRTGVPIAAFTRPLAEHPSKQVSFSELAASRSQKYAFLADHTRDFPARAVSND